MQENKWQGLIATLQAQQAHEIGDVLCGIAEVPRRVLLALLVLQLRGAWVSAGICWYVQELCRIVRPLDVLRPHFESWEHYSGEDYYPIEGDVTKYIKHHKWDGRYGAARRALLQHCIEGLCKQLDTNVEYERLLLELEFNKRKEELHNAHAITN